MPRNGSVGLNGRARLCEDAYTNRPGEVVAASSTAAALEAAWAVRSAGTLTLSSADAGFVVREDGADDPIGLPYSWRVDGEGFGSRQFRVEKASGTTIGATGAFTLDYEPDDSGEELTASAEVTVVKIKVEATEDWPENRVRHIFGPKEEATITIEPASAAVMLGQVLRDRGGISAVDGKWVLTSPDAPGAFEIEMGVGDCLSTALPFEVIAPQGLRGENPREPEYFELAPYGICPVEDWIAGVQMHIDVFVEPDIVSFARVKLYEEYALPSERSGCYTNLAVFTDGWLRHGAGAGASDGQLNNVMTVVPRNEIDGGDVAGNWFDRWHRAYANGTYKLEIPLRWFVVGGSVTNRLPNNTQKIWLFDDGRMRVRKNGKTLERNIHGDVHEIFD